MTTVLEVLEGRLASLKQSISDLALEQFDLESLHFTGDESRRARENARRAQGRDREGLRLMASTQRQPSFAGGELAPVLQGRTDHPVYGSGVRKMLNFIALPQGAVQNRPGLKFVAATKDSTQSAIQVP